MTMTNLILLTEICFKRWIMAWNPLPRLTTLKITQTWYSINPTWKLCFQMLKHDENYSFQDDLQSQDPQLNPEVSNANTERTLLGRFWTGQRRSWERNCWQRNVTRSLTLMGFGLKTWMTRWMVRCHCFLKNHNLLNPRRQGAIPGCSPWTSPVLPLIKVFLLVDNLPIIIHWCFILREENEGAGEEEERRRWRFW